MYEFVVAATGSYYKRILFTEIYCFNWKDTYLLHILRNEEWKFQV